MLFRSLNQRLQRSEIKIALEIPPGFGRDLYAGRQPTVAAWLDGGMPFRAETSRSYVQAVHQANLEQLATLSSQAQNRQASVKLETRFRYNQDVISINTRPFNTKQRLSQKFTPCSREVLLRNKCRLFDKSNPPLTTAKTPELCSSSAVRYMI